MSQDFLFELGCEELPSKAVLALSTALTENMQIALLKHELSFKAIKAFAAPRRLAFLIIDLATQQPDQQLTRRGPAVEAAFDAAGNPTPALLGFAKSCGVEASQLSRFQTEKGEWLVYETNVRGAPTSALLPELIKQVVEKLPISKPMRWGNHPYEFARPVHWAVMLFGDEAIEAALFGIKSGRNSYGHRFHHPEAVPIAQAGDYENALQQAYVLVDFQKRQQRICEQVNALSEPLKATPIMPQDLLDEVTSIVEWPCALQANFSPSFLEVPSEVLIAAMQEHQKCFALQAEDGALLPHFITIANIESRDPKQVIAGNEKVMQARLSDAAFFFAQDKKTPLILHNLNTVVFQAKLGTLSDKTTRVKSLMTFLAMPLKLEKAQAIRAAELSKCDLLTGMVGEFPELQGLMGFYYASHDGEDKLVAKALYEQYLPRFSADHLPETDLGLALSLADRVDTLVGIFLIGQKPTGVKDPFKLRRHALAVLRLLSSHPAQLALTDLLNQALLGYAEQGISVKQFNLSELADFIFDRLEGYYQQVEISADIVRAVKARQADWLFDMDKRIKALSQFVHLPEAAILSAACKRVNNLLQQQDVHDIIDVNLLSEGAEQALYTHMEKLDQHLAKFYKTGDYVPILTELTSLREPVDAFFTQVMVMVDDSSLKQNRLALLARLQTMLQSVADISLLNQKENA